MILEKSIYYFVQHAIRSINTLQLLMVIKISCGYCCLMICNLYFSLKKSSSCFYHKFYTGFISRPLPALWLGTLRAGELLSKIQDNACFVGFKQTLLPYKVVAYTGGIDCRVI